MALNRGNISDSLMILLLVLAADAVSAAIATREEHARRAQALLILAAFWVGLAFQAKMIEAWLLLPALGLAYLLDGPGVTAHHESAFDAPFEPARLAALIASAPAKLAKIQQTIPRLQAVQANAPDLLAAQSSYTAAVFIYTSGLEALPIGGFTGTIPSPTLAQLKTDIASHQFHLVLALSTKDPRMRWIATHCRDLGPARSSASLPARQLPRQLLRQNRASLARGDR